ncbi:MAG: hypothetical protein N3E52_01765 [Candidatus Bathyarchaeota archaeon]|nr:hypothetical protein [Candidatus Bathyarchaeota archaeon]
MGEAKPPDEASRRAEYMKNCLDLIAFGTFGNIISSPVLFLQKKSTG